MPFRLVFYRMSESVINIPAPGSCFYDCIALGEVMLRFDPGEGRIRTSRNFRVWEGGGEYNVVRGLRRCFGVRTAIVTSLVDNEVGRLLEDLMLQGGVDLEFIQWTPHDGIGKRVRNGLNFTERGFGVRGAIGVSDRGNSASSQLRVGQIDWERIFAERKTRWFHTGGIFAGLSDSAAEVALEACTKAKEHGVSVSYDLNYRPSLWQDRGGSDKAKEINRRIAPLVDVMIGNEEDFVVGLGLGAGGLEKGVISEEAEFADICAKASQVFPNFKVIATSVRNVRSASNNDWSALCWSEGKIHQSAVRDRLDVMDRVGGGDSFASGLIYGFLTNAGPATAVQLGAAHGALAMTTPGDSSMATLKEVEKLVAGGNARVER